MRSYPIDSPEAATRLLAMAVLADGHCSITELNTLDRLSAPARLGIAPDAFKAVIDRFCEDLRLAHHGEWLGSAAIDSATRRSLLAEVQNPALGAEVRALCEAVLRAHGLEYAIRWHRGGEPFHTGEGALRTAAREVLAGFSGGVLPEESTGGGTSDARFIAPLGVQCIEVGPVNASIHKVDEHVRVADLERLPDLYLRLMERLLVD